MTKDLLWTYPYHTLAALFFGCMLFRQLKKGKTGTNPKGLPLPPGPKGFPLIGNIFNMPVNKPWLVTKNGARLTVSFPLIKRPLSSSNFTF
jgi:hypothetical protein